MPQDYDFSHHLSPSDTAGALSLDIPSPLPLLDTADDPEDDQEDEQNEPEYVELHSLSKVRRG